MAKQDKSSKSGFVIKLSCETVEKLTKEAHNAEKDKKPADSKVESSPNQEKAISLETENSLPNLEVSSDDSKEPKDDPEKTDNSKSSVDESNKNLDSVTTNIWGAYAPYITYEGEEAIYTDPSTQQKYIWSETTKSWTPRSGVSEASDREYSYENDTHVYTEADGSKFFWDVDKKAWIPKVDDDFLAMYQMSYGFVDNSEKKEETENKETQKKQDVGVKRKNEPQWFEQSEENNTKVYVSNLPGELTEEEFVNFMQKCGLVERDARTQKMKVKLYMDKEQNCFKGDALCTYIKIESVDLALKLLDGSDLNGNKIKVERAHFQLKGAYNPALKPKKKKKKELEKIKKMQQKLFDWRPEKFVGERSKHERVVIVKNVFQPSDFDKEVQLILDYQQDLREECSKCGEVRKVVIYDRHPEGVAQVTMKEPEEADAVVQLINGRWFGKRQLTAEIWDGRTKYRIAETDADLNQRKDKWENFLEGKEGNNRQGISVDPVSENKESNSEIEQTVISTTEKPEICLETDKESIK